MRGRYYVDLRDDKGRLLSRLHWNQHTAKTTKKALRAAKKQKTTIEPRAPDKRLYRVQIVLGSPYEQGGITSASIRLWVVTRNPEKYSANDLRDRAEHIRTHIPNGKNQYRELPIDLDAIEEREISEEENRGQKLDEVQTQIRIEKKGRVYQYNERW